MYDINGLAILYVHASPKIPCFQMPLLCFYIPGPLILGLTCHLGKLTKSNLAKKSPLSLHARTYNTHSVQCQGSIKLHLNSYTTPLQITHNLQTSLTGRTTHLTLCKSQAFKVQHKSLTGEQQMVLTSTVTM